jgi:hypothetical protein
MIGVTMPSTPTPKRRTAPQAPFQTTRATLQMVAAMIASTISSSTEL